MGSIFGYEVVSDAPLRRLSDAVGARGRVHVVRTDRPLLDRPGELTVWHEQPGGPGFALARSGVALLAWCGATGEFEIDAYDATVRCNCRADGDGWEHRIGTMAVPLLLAERGELAVHAAAVGTCGRAVLFAGPSGRGKSTLALAASEGGHSVLSEDGVTIDPDDERLRVWPGLRGVRVAVPDRLNGSRGRRDFIDLPAGQEAREPLPLGAICLLGERGERLEIRPLSPAAAVPALVPSLVHSGEPAALARAFALLARVLVRVPAYRVSLPDDLRLVGPSVRSLLEQLAL
jgi:hypothetical protein